MFDFVHPDDREAVRKRIRDTPATLQMSVTARQTYWLKWKGNLHGSNGMFDHPTSTSSMQVVYRDISQRKEAERSCWKVKQAWRRQRVAHLVAGSGISLI